MLSPTYNIIVVDVFAGQYDMPYIQSKYFNVIALVVDSECQKENIGKHYPNITVYCAKDIAEWDITYAQAQDIDTFSHAHLKFERYVTRYGNQTTLLYDAQKNSYFYNSLAFWKYIFTNNPIDVIVILGELEHGCSIDSIPMDIAKSMGIPVIITDIILSYSEYQLLYAIKHYNLNQYLKLSQISQDAKQFNLETYVANHKVLFADDLKKAEFMHTSDSIMSNNVSKHPHLKAAVYLYICMQIYAHKIAGVETAKDIETVRLKNYIIQLVRMNNLLYSFIFKYILPLGYSYGRGIRYMIPQYVWSNFKQSHRELKNYYSQHATSKITTPGVLYALHLEPEASIMNRTTYNSQLYNIRMLSAALPKNWIIYVKEHPATFQISLTHNDSFAPTLSQYRNVQYYKDLLSLPNVRLIDYQIPVVDLITKNPQIKAVASINGTVALECMKLKIAVILFDMASTPYNDIEDIFSVTCYEDLVLAFDRLIHGFKPEYKDYNHKISNYLIPSKNGFIDMSEDLLYDVVKYVKHCNNK